MIDKKILLQLRKQTSLGMMVCRKALVEANGDFDQAIEILRKQGKKIANKKLGREIEQGAIFTKTNQTQTAGVLVAMGCETDFVAKSGNFVELSNYIVDIALEKRPATKEELLALKTDRGTIQEAIVNLIGVLGENITLAEYYLCEGELVAGYVHTGNKLGSVVVLNQSGDTAEKLQAAKDMALQVVAGDPLAVTGEGIEVTILDKEKELIDKELAEDNKPQEVKEKIKEGRIRKFIEKSTLLTQNFVKDETITNGAYLANVASGFTVKRFKRAAVLS